MTLAGAQVVVVGGSSGIGLATAAFARQQGAHVTIAGRSAERLAQAQKTLGDVRTVVADIASEEAVQGLCQTRPCGSRAGVRRHVGQWQDRGE